MFQDFRKSLKAPLAPSSRACVVAVVVQSREEERRGERREERRAEREAALTGCWSTSEVHSRFLLLSVDSRHFSSSRTTGMLTRF